MADSGLDFQGGQLDYIEQLNTLVTFSEDYATEVENARDGEATLLAALQGRVKSSGMQANLKANGFRITGLADPEAPQDAATRAFVSAIVQGGGQPSDIAITGLGLGDLQRGGLVTSDGVSVTAIGPFPAGAVLTSNGTDLITRGRARRRYLGA